MNNLFRDPYELLGLPEYLEEYLLLENAFVCCISMNHRGTICAAGCFDGTVVLWDMSTRGVGRVYKPHEGRITSLWWSRNGRILVTSSLDNSVVWWNVEENKQIRKQTFPQPVTYACIQPREPMICLASLQQGAPQIVDGQSDGEPQVTDVPTLVVETDSKTGCQVSICSEGVTAVALLSPCGRLVYVGQQKGTLLVLRRSDLKVLDVIRIQGNARVTALAMDKKGGKLLVNCSDRTLRLYVVEQKLLEAALAEQLPDVEDVKKQLATQKVAKQGSALRGDNALVVKEREFANAVERMQWKAACFTEDGDHVVAVPDAKGKHHIYIWNELWGKLEKVLEGPKEGALDVTFDPSSNMLLSVGQTGRVFLWCRKRKDNWSAFAPDFKELAENEEYIEAEDEFDINDKDDKPADEMVDFSEEVDIFTPPSLQPRYSVDANERDEDGFWHLPVEIDADAEEGAPAKANGAAAGAGAARAAKVTDVGPTAMEIDAQNGA